MNMEPGDGRTPRFATVLAARANNARPSDLEVQLRDHCQKIRVSEKLSGAHFVFPTESSMAVRVYYPSDVAALEAQLTSSVSMESDDLDGIVHFSKQFRLSLVILVDPPNYDEQGRQCDVGGALNRLQSFQHRVQTILETRSDNPWTRVIVTPSTAHAIAGIISVADSIRRNTTKLKSEFFESHCRQLTGAPATRDAFTAWSQQNQFALGDAAMLLQFHPTLSIIFSSDLNGLPYDARTKELMRSLLHNKDEDTDYVDLGNDTIPSVRNDPTIFMSSLSGTIDPSHLYDVAESIASLRCT